ncbi:MAG TPA: outer membrane protein transport protein [Acidobacteriota bacterium]
MKQRMRTVQFLMTVALIALAAVSLSANGLNLNGVGSKAIAMGGAFIGQADDYSAIFWNPAGLTQMKSPSISFFVTDLIPSGTYRFPLLGIDAETKSAMYPSGSVAYFKPINDKLIVGIAAYVPSGTGAKWNGEDLKLLTKGVAYRWESFMGVITVSPVIAYKVSDQFSLGATLNLNYGMLKLWRPGVGQYNEDLNGFAFGATIGALFKPIDKLGIGLTLRMPTKVKFSGDATMAGAALVGQSTTSKADREATWPLWLGLGISFKATDKLTLNADAQFTNWKKVQTIGITYDNAGWQALKAHPVLGAAFNNDFVLNWKNAIQWRFGLEYAASEKLALRAGYYYDPSPSDPATLNILLPEISYNVATVGLGYKADNLAVDVCVEYLMGKDVLSPMSGKMPGTHGMSILVPNIAFTFRF